MVSKYLELKLGKPRVKSLLIALRCNHCVFIGVVSSVIRIFFPIQKAIKQIIDFETQSFSINFLIFENFIKNILFIDPYCKGNLNIIFLIFSTGLISSLGLMGVCNGGDLYIRLKFATIIPSSPFSIWHNL